MIVRIADNITSPLGVTTAANVEAVRQGRSALALHQLWGIPEPFMASLFEVDAEGMVIGGGFPHSYEGACLYSIQEALSQVPDLDIASPRVALVLASTKGSTTGDLGRPFAASAAYIAQAIGLTTTPVTVSNACISGLSAQILAHRLLTQGHYDTVIVTGCDIQTLFIVAGFQSFKALSTDECQPFDEDRYGLNLGEAAATIIYSNRTPQADDWVMIRGAVRNDAFHISGPSRTAEGSYRALRQVIKGEDADQLACINAHGTATLYNDDMESKAIDRAHLSHLPVNSLKGYFGHTMGAAGVLETILSMHAIDEGWIPATRGFHALGTSRSLCVSGEHLLTQKRQFVKLMSGFGGCNAAALFKKGDQV